MRHNFRNSSLAAFAAGATLFAQPAMAAQLPASSVETGVAQTMHGWGWGGGYGGRHHRDRGVDVGDVLAGVLVIGAIAAIADAADDDNDNNRRRRDEREYRDDREYRGRFDNRTDTRSNLTSSRGIDSAVAMCVDQVERGEERVDSVDNAARTNDGWRVSGALQDGAGWSCWIDNDGRVREIDLASADAQTGFVAASNGQLSDETYASARAAQHDGTAAVAQPAATTASEPRPAYPGGPLPGEEGYAESIAAGTTT